MFIIRRALANILTFFGVTVGLVVIVLLIISLIYVRNAIPAASVIVWFLIGVILVVGLILVLIGVVVYGVSFFSKYIARTKREMIEVQRLEVEQETYAATQDAQRRAIEASLQQPMLPGNQPNLALPQPGNGKPQPVYYRAIKQLIKPGQLLIGIKPDGTLRVGEWNDYKTVLVLGGSSSGKTTTIIEIVLCAIRAGALIVVCDPHANKEDSLLRRIHPLRSFLFPGTMFAVDHKDIIKNVRAIKKELDRRVKDKSGVKQRMVVLIVEEWNRLQRDKQVADELMEIAQELGQEGRGFNIFGVFGAQQITGNVELRKSVISAIVHRVDESEAQLVIPTRYAKFAPELSTGSTYVKDSDGRTEALQQALVTVQDIQETANEMMPFTPAASGYQQPNQVQQQAQQAPMQPGGNYWQYGQPIPATQPVAPDNQQLVKIIPFSELNNVNGYNGFFPSSEQVLASQPVPQAPMQRPQWVDSLVDQQEIINTPTTELTPNEQPTDENPIVDADMVEPVREKLDIHQKLARFVIRKQRF